ncbi:DUF3618 domain-containing protein [Salipiger sp. PrR007]|uniref:DUF3618 domain-containing protein n=1 Tax=Salipiger sp. PrR007 TaxID=2706884 RepID=UPI0013B8995D|nr:DUF3618 domain-containing protein [Salipiger sp. PrR007]NDW32744.1 DUF3618 domain-containing protein [Salipiger sp. PrR007]
MAEPKRPSEIEREIDQERQALNASISELQNRFSPDEIFVQIGRHLQTHGRDMGQALSKSAKQNPIGLTLTAAGIAFLAFGRSFDEEEDNRLAGDPLSRRVRRRQDVREGFDRDNTDTEWSTPRAGYGAGLSAHYHDDLHRDDDDSEGFRTRVERAQARLQARFEQERAGVSEGFTSARRTVGEARDALSERADRAQSFLQEGYDRIAAGTEQMSEAARRRVLGARERALIARERTARQANRASAEAFDLYDKHPLVAGALAMALGAAFGGALPRSRAEDSFVGEYSDALFAEAEEIFAEERDRLAAVADAALDEGAAIARNVRAEADARTPGDKPAEQALSDAAKTAGRRMEERIRDEADRQFSASATHADPAQPKSRGPSKP